MIFQNLHKIILENVKFLQQFAGRFWFSPLIGLLAFLDNLILIIPNDGILISSSMLIPKKWLTFALSVTIGSTLGALTVVTLVKSQGLPWILNYYPAMDETQLWEWTNTFFEKYGLILLFIIGITPFTQHPVLILASLGEAPFTSLVIVIFLSRLIKFLTMGYVGTHAPRLLSKFWGIKDELKDSGVKLE